MAIPTFAGFSLFTDSAIENIGTIEPRNYTETLPNVNGEFVQPTGNGGRTITSSGFLGASTEVALKTLIANWQKYANGRTVDTYIGSDSASYSTCILLSYSHGQVMPLVGSFRCSVTANFRQLNPAVS